MKLFLFQVSSFKFQVKIIILAGGRGTRLAQKSASDIPKALVEIAGKPILEHQIDHLESHGLSDIRLALGFRAQQIIDYLGGRYEHIVESEPLGTGGAIKFASFDRKEQFLVLNGDVLSDFNFASFISQAEKNKNYIAIAHHKQNTDFGLIEIDSSGKVIKFLEKPNEPIDGYISVGFYILQPNIFENIDKKIFSIEYDIFPKLATDGHLHSFEHCGFWADLGTEERLILMHQKYQNKS